MTVRWFRAVCWLGLAVALVLLGIGLRPSFGAEKATVLEGGGKYAGAVIVCIAQPDAEHLRDLLAASNVEAARDYLIAPGNTCGGNEDAEFTADAAVGPVKPDSEGRGWHLIRVTIQSGDLFLVTTSEFRAKGGRT